VTQFPLPAQTSIESGSAAMDFVARPGKATVTPSEQPISVQAKPALQPVTAQARRDAKERRK
jgi:hypothetical protein